MISMSSHMQQPSNSVDLGLPQPRRESAIRVPPAMTGPYGMWPPAPHQFSGLRPPVPQQFGRLQAPVQQQFNRLQLPVTQYFSPVKTRMPDFSPDRRSFSRQKNSSPLNQQHKSGFHKDGEKGREWGNRRLVIDL